MQVTDAQSKRVGGIFDSKECFVKSINDNSNLKFELNNNYKGKKSEELMPYFTSATYSEMRTSNKKPEFIAPKFERETSCHSSKIEDEWNEIEKQKLDLKKKEAELTKLADSLSIRSPVSSASSKDSINSSASNRSKAIVVQPVNKVDTGGGMWGFAAPSTLPVLLPNGEIMYPKKSKPKPPRSERIRREKEEQDKRDREKMIEEHFKASSKTRELNDAKALEILENKHNPRERSQSVNVNHPWKINQGNLHKSRSQPSDCRPSTSKNVAHDRPLNWEQERMKAYPIPEPPTDSNMDLPFHDSISLADSSTCNSFPIFRKLFKRH